MTMIFCITAFVVGLSCCFSVRREIRTEMRLIGLLSGLAFGCSLGKRTGR